MGRLVPMDFWEEADAHVVTLCQYMQQCCGYDGEDAAFEEMDGELMNVRVPTSRPWSLSEAVGNEGSERWSLVLAALCAGFSSGIEVAFGQEEGAQLQCALQTQSAGGVVQTHLSSSYALIFTPSLKSLQGAQVEASARWRGTLRGGEGAWAEACALREGLHRSVDAALSGDHGPSIAVLDEATLGRLAGFLRSPLGELSNITAISQGQPISTKIVETYILKPNVSFEWSLALLEVTDIRCRKRRAIAQEDYALAKALKAKENEANARVRKAQSSASSERAVGITGELEALEKQKRAAVEAEDFDRAAQIKRRQKELAHQHGEVPNGSVQKQLDKILEEKRICIESEDFDRATELRRIQTELETKLQTLDQTVPEEVTAEAIRLASGNELELTLEWDSSLREEIIADLKRCKI